MFDLEGITKDAEIIKRAIRDETIDEIIDEIERMKERKNKTEKYFIVWGPKGCLLQERHANHQCGRNSISFETKEQAFKYIAESNRFEDYERKLCWVVKTQHE